MADNKTEIILSARDDTRAAFASIESGLGRLTGSSVKLGDSFKGVALAAAGLAGIGSFAVLKGKIEDAIGSMADLKEMSEKTGASVENLSALKGVAKIGGRDFDAISDQLVKFNKALHGTDDESKGAGKALAALGLDIQKLREMDPAAAFVELARAQEKFADGGGKSAAMVAILGKSGAQAIPYLHDLADQMQLVGKVTADQAKAADDYEKNLKRLNAAWSALSRQLAGSVIGPLKDITDWMVKAQKEGGAVEAVFMGIGAAVVKAFGGEINPAKIMEQDVAKAFAEVRRLDALSKKTQADIEAGNFGILGEAFSRGRLKDINADLAAAERRLKSLTAANQKRVKDEIAADRPKDKSLDKQTFGAAPKTGGTTEQDKAAALIKTLDDQIAVKALDLQATDKLTESEKEYARVLQQLDTGILKATPRQRELILGKLEFLRVADQELVAQEKQRQAVEAQQKVMADYLPGLEEQARKLEEAATLYGLNEAQIAAVTQARLEDAIATAKQNGAGEEQIAFLERELAARRRITTAQQQIQDQKEKLNELDDFAKNAAKGMQDAMAEFLFDPFKHGTQGMLQGFGEMIQKMIAQAVAADLARKLFGDLVQGGEGKGLVGGALDWLGGLLKNADGGVYAGAGIGAYSGTIVSRPTVFPFARGIGLMGEAGPEAILPLKRGSDGKLGVSAGGGHAIMVNVAMTDGDPAKVHRAAAAGAREALAIINGARRYG